MTLHHTMIWLFINEVPNNSLSLRENVLSRPSSITLTNGFFAVESFLFLSTVLTSYLTLREMQHIKGHFPFLPYYVHRVLRILPIYLFILFIYWLLLPFFADGPVWDSQVSQGITNCERFWWTNLLFINNLYPWKLQDQCMFWAWFVAANMQFYVVAPLIVVPLYYSAALGGGVLCVSLLVSLIVTGTLTGHFELNANLFQSLLESLAIPGIRSSGDYLYTKPWARMP